MRGAAPRQIAALLTPGDVRLLLEAKVFFEAGTGGVRKVSWDARWIEKGWLRVSRTSLFFFLPWFLGFLRRRGGGVGRSCSRLQSLPARFFPFVFKERIKGEILAEF